MESPPLSPAHDFELYGWRPDPSLSDDENYLDVVFLVTRSVQEDGQQGHMGALIVRPRTSTTSDVTNNSPSSSSTTTSKESSSMDYETVLYRNILGAATNTPLFGTKDCTSDIHAEINALGQACRSSQSTENCTAYITIPPCKRCFAALVSFGIKRIVTRQSHPPIIRDTAMQLGMETRHLSYDEKRRQMQRINRLVNPDRTDEELMEITERIKQQRLTRKKKTSNENCNSNRECT